MNNTTLAQIHSPPPPSGNREWLAHLQLQFRPGTSRTQLFRMQHQGPMVVQRPFYPESEVCHAYILHPPGGIAAGDSLQLDVQLHQGSRVLLTTPSATKVYASDNNATLQRQSLHAELAHNTCLEWLPQESIVFNSANVELINRFQLQGNAQLIAWDFVCLGRRASGEQFNSGECVQRIEIDLDGQPLLRERCCWRGGDAMLHGSWGMAGNCVSGTLFATFNSNRAQRDEWRQSLSELNPRGLWGISQKPGLFLARYLGNSPEQGRAGFEFLWRCLRPEMMAREVCRPRIWNT